MAVMTRAAFGRHWPSQLLRSYDPRIIFAVAHQTNFHPPSRLARLESM
jgi:hypothetical protein